METFATKRKPPNSRIRPRYGPYTRATSLTQIDGRCRIARQIREFTATLVQHVGGSPTAAQAVLIREAAIKNAKVAMLVDTILAGQGVDLDCATRTYLAWSNSLRRDLEALGMTRPDQQLPSPIEYLAARRKPAA
jgi:hypothetical protein